ncbi:hypothetical protein DM02DRAFT_695335 [Periconia macrospinosa]|uniref:Uncharacterized protein n=1 Tax=Periconia macrospinosa TaxID=97972 RepID=A0A2V1D6H0_9PLEO|nr:hypothetical protein DM02DRAFT_695335 [Periconia macrospinosa]
MSADGEGPSDQPVIARSMPIEHSLIGDEAVYSRNLGASTNAVNKMVNVPDPSGRSTSLKVKTAVSLTWRRPKEYKSKPEVFYIVPERFLDTDVVLSSAERQFPSDVDEEEEEEEYTPQARMSRGSFHARNFSNIKEVDDPSPPPSPTLHMPYYQPPHINQVPDRTRASRETHHRREQAESSGLKPPPRHAESGGSATTTAPSAAQNPSSGQLQVGGSWEKTQIKFAFDPEASGEAFWQSFYQWATQRKRDGQLERNRVTIQLRGSRNQEDDFFELPLNEDDIVGYWEEAIDWIQSNKRANTPHLFATIILDAG